jgi:two-component system, cell cycle sensor histidine kinase and response regulator CckA
MDANDMKTGTVSSPDGSPSQSSFRPLNSLPVIIISVSLLLLTLLLWKLYDRSLQARAEVIFADKTGKISSQITGRMRDHERVLRGARGLFAVNENVSRTDWRHYVTALQLDENLPGILGVGFSKWLTPAEKSANISKIRAEGFPEYTIRPDGERSVYTSIIYLEPFNWRNQRAFGYDMYAESRRKATMDKARDENVATVAAKIVLVQETDKDKQSGMLMYVPVYHNEMQINTVAERRAALLGFTYSPVRMNDFVSETLEHLPEDIAFTINVGGGSPADTFMFSSVQADKRTVPEQYKAALSKTTTVQAYGCAWKYTFTTLPAFDKEMGRSKSYLVLIAGILFSVLLSGLLSLMVRNRSLVIERTKENLRQSNSYLDSLFSNANAPIIIWDTNFRTTDLLARV